MDPGRQRRRLATILASDVAGYSRLMAEDEEATLRTLKAFRVVIDNLIARHEGRIFNTAGDSVLAEFGSAVEAVRCAISIQEELRVRNEQLDARRRLFLRIGINVGDVLIDGDNIYGDGVNVAARLESIAEPGGICLSGSTVALVKNKLSYAFEDIGPQSVKNIPEPVPAFRLLPGGGAAVTAQPAATQAAPRPPQRRFGAGAVAVAAAGAALLAAGGAWFFWLQAKPPTAPDSGAGTNPATWQPSARQLERMKPLVGMTVHGLSAFNGKPFTVALGPDGKADAEMKNMPVPGEIYRERGRWWITDRRAVCWHFSRFSRGEMRCRQLEREGDGFRGIPRDTSAPIWTIKR